MSQLDDRLRAGLSALVDDVAPTRSPEEVLADLRARPALVAGARPPARPHRRRALVAVAAFVVVVLGMAALVLSRDRTEQPTHVDVTPSTAPTGSWDPRGLGAGWHDLPPGPFDGVSPKAMVWTGSELVLWHGERYGGGTQTDDGATFDPATGSWRSTGPDPLVGRGIGAGGGAWTGTEAVFWSDLGIVLWDPGTRTWRAAAPTTERMSSRAVWDGDRVLMWSVGLAYDPGADSWSSIPLPPDLDPSEVPDAVATWTGTELVVVAGRRNLAFDPSSGEWTDLGTFDQAGWDQVTASGVVVGDELWVISGCCESVSGRALSLEDRTWRTLSADEVPPVSSSEGHPTLAWLGDPADGGVLYAAHGGIQSRLVDGTWTDPVATHWASAWVVVDGALVVPSESTMKIYVPPEAGSGADGVSIDEARPPTPVRTVSLPISGAVDGLGGTFPAGAFPSVPSALTIDGDGNIRVVDWVKSRVATFDPTGAFLTSDPGPSLPADVAADGTGELLLGLLGREPSVLALGPGGVPAAPVAAVPVVRMAETGGSAWVETGVGVWQRVDGQGGHEVLLGGLPLSRAGSITSLSLEQSGSLATFTPGSGGGRSVRLDMGGFSAAGPLLAEPLGDGGWVVAFSAWSGETSRLLVVVVDAEDRIDHLLQLPTPTAFLEADQSGVRWDPSTGQIAVVTGISPSAVQIEWFEVR